MKLQALYASLCIAWNATVIWQVQSGVQPIGPTGSVAVIVGAVIFILLLSFALRKGWEGLYIILASLVSLLASTALYSSLTNSAEMWPSQFWQTAGLIVNGIGAISFVLVLAIYIKSRNSISTSQ